MRNSYNATVTKPILVLLGCLFFIVSTSMGASAKSSEHSRQVAAGIVTNEKQALRLKNSGELKVRRLRAVANKAGLLKAPTKGPSKGCGCPALPGGGAGSFGSCLRGCLAEVGISPYALIMCGAACAAAWTGGGAIVCAICVGVSVTVIEVCALGCAQEGGKEFGGLLDARNIKHRKAPVRSSPGISLRQAKA
jgi:hypothetical protein